MATDMDRILVEMRDDFLQDCREKLLFLDDILGKLDRRDDSFEGLFVELKRCVHSIKGNAGSFGFPSISHIAHSLEDFIGTASDEQAVSVAGMGKYVSRMSEIVEGGEDISEEETLNLINALPTNADSHVTSGKSSSSALIHIPEKVWNKIMTQELTSHGFRVSTTETAFEAIDRGVMLQPELLITGMQLNRMTGVELAQVFNTLKSTQGTRVLILAAQPQADLDRMEKPENTIFLEKCPNYREHLVHWIGGGDS